MSGAAPPSVSSSAGQPSVPPGPALGVRRRALLLLVASLLALWTVWATVVLPSLQPLEGWSQTVRSIGIRVLLWIVPCVVYAKSLGLPLTLVPWYFQLPPTARHWFVAGLTTLAAGIAVSLDVARKLSVTPLDVWRLLLQGNAVGIPTAEFFEELVFRGIILTEMLMVIPATRPATGLSELDASMTQRSRFWLANLATSLVFTGLHWPWWIYTQGIGVAFWLNTGGVFLISLVLGMLFVYSRSLWPAVALHWLNNSLSGLAPG